MNSDRDMGGVTPAVPFLLADKDGRFHLAGSRCTACNEVVPGHRTICIGCGARDQMKPIQLGDKGRLYSYTIVHRSFPGVRTPFIAVIVCLNGGGTIKGTLVDVDPSPDAVRFDMPLKLVFRESGQVSTEGASFISYYFAPEQESSDV